MLSLCRHAAHAGSDPDERWDAARALAHPYFDKFRCEDTEPQDTPPQFNWEEFEPRDVTVDQWKECVFHEISQLQAFNDPDFLKDWHPNGVGLLLASQSSDVPFDQQQIPEGGYLF